MRIIFLTLLILLSLSCGPSSRNPGSTTSSSSSSSSSSSGSGNSNNPPAVCSNITDKNTCNSTPTCWHDNTNCLKLYKSCTQITDSKECASNGNNQKKDTLKCKYENNTCVTDFLDKDPPQSSLVPLNRVKLAYKSAGWQFTREAKAADVASVKPNSPEVLTGLHKVIMSKDRQINVVYGDITQEVVSAIVNAGKPSLEGGSGVDGAIHTAAGKSLKDEAIAYKKHHNITSFSLGSAMITYSYNLSDKIQFIIHTVGPSGVSTDEKNQQLFSAVYYSLVKAQEHNLTIIAIPAISTGIFGFPIDVATELFFKAALLFFDDFRDTSITEIRFTNYDTIGDQGKTVKAFIDRINTI